MGGKPESAVAEALVSTFPDADIVSHCGKAAWKETFDIIGKAAVLLTGDTGAMHAGAALQVPMVVVWGCTSPALGMGPWLPHPETVELEPESPVRQRPCSRLGDRCRHKIPCPQRVAPERITAALDGILSRTAP
jgi:heptosyltransferase-2